MKLIIVFFISILLFTPITVTPISINNKPIINNEKYDDVVLDNLVVHQWPMFKHDPRHTGLSEYDTSSNPGVEKWKYFVDTPLHHSALIDKDGILYLGDGSNGLHAVYPDGTMKWKTKFPWPITYPRELAIDTDGTIYIPSDTHFLAYYPNGTLKWILDLGEWKIFTGDPTIDSNGIVYVGDDDGYLYAVYPNGTIKWEYKINGYVTDPALDDQGNIYFTSYNGRLYCLNPNGTLKWNTEQFASFQYGPVIGDDGTIYALPHSDKLFAFYPNGTMKWRKVLSDVGGLVSIALDGTLIVCGYNVAALDPNDGDVLWIYRVKDIGVGDWMTGAAISSDGTIFFAYPKCICALTPDGHLKWKEHLSTDVFPYDGMDVQFGTPSIGSDGTVYVTSWFRREGSNYTDVGYIHAIAKGNPDAPSTPVLSGKIRGLPMVNYEFSIAATSPSGRDVYYQVDWSDRYSYTDWIGPYHSGETIKLKHHWVDERKYYQIAVRAKDVNGVCSPWGEYGFRTFPFDKGIMSYGCYLLNLIEQFPLLEKIVRAMIF